MKKWIDKAVYFYNTGMWKTPAHDAGAMRLLLLGIAKKLILAIKFFTAKRVLSDAAALTYSTMLAIVPIMAVVFAIARGFGYNRYIEMWFRSALQSQPQAADVIVGFVNSYLVHTKSGIFLGIGLAFMLYTVLMLVRNVEAVFNGIWQAKKPRSIFRTFTDYLAMIFLCPIIIVLTSGISLVAATAADGTADLIVVGTVAGLAIDLLPYVVMSTLFTGLYIFMPNTHVKPRSAIIPGILAGVAMQWLQLFYIHSQIWVSSYNAIYGSFAALPLFMLWVQISWTICLFGAELCYTNQNLDYYDYNMLTDDLSLRYRTMLCALLLSRICKRFEEGKRPYTALELRKETGVPIRIVNELLYNLTSARLTVEINRDEKGDTTRYMPAESTAKLSYGMMVDRLESCGKWKLDMPVSQYYSEKWAQVLNLRNRYLKDLREVLIKDL